MSNIEIISKEISAQLENKEISTALLSTTFKGFQPAVMKQAIMEGMIRGFEFKDFLEKNVYAIPFGGGYSLITSIDYARKLAMRSGLAGKTAPKYVFSDNEKKTVETCEITVKKVVDGMIAEFTSLVYFKEFNTGKNQWASKPLVMIAKVAEMHALRMAFPEQMSKQYVEEEMDKEVAGTVAEPLVINVVSAKEKLNAVTSLAELVNVWKKVLTTDERAVPELLKLKDELKDKLTPKA